MNVFKFNTQKRKIFKEIDLISDLTTTHLLNRK